MEPSAGSGEANHIKNAGEGLQQENMRSRPPCWSGEYILNLGKSPLLMITQASLNSSDGKSCLFVGQKLCTSSNVLQPLQKIQGWSVFLQAFAGVAADGRQIANRAADEARQYQRYSPRRQTVEHLYYCS